MATVEELKHKIITANDLKSVVKTMKALAAVSIHQYEKAVESLAEYNRTLEMGWQIMLQRDSLISFKSSSFPPKKMGLVIFGSDWGMCGQFNERIADYTDKLLQKLMGDRPTAESADHSWLSDRLLIANVGARIESSLQTKGYSCNASFHLPSSVMGITTVIQQLVLTLENWREQYQVERIDLIYNSIDSGMRCQPRQLQIFPLDLAWLQRLKQQKWAGTSLPTFNLDQDKLAASLFRQYFFVTLYRACAESLKSENTSRLTAMQMAEKNINERLSELNTQFNQQRQTGITEELLDIVAGFEALND